MEFEVLYGDFGFSDTNSLNCFLHEHSFGSQLTAFQTLIMNFLPADLLINTELEQTDGDRQKQGRIKDMTTGFTYRF